MDINKEILDAHLQAADWEATSLPIDVDLFNSHIIYLSIWPSCYVIPCEQKLFSPTKQNPHAIMDALKDPLVLLEYNNPEPIDIPALSRHLAAYVCASDAYAQLRREGVDPRKRLHIFVAALMPNGEHYRISIGFIDSGAMILPFDAVEPLSESVYETMMDELDHELGIDDIYGDDNELFDE